MDLLGGEIIKRRTRKARRRWRIFPFIFPSNDELMKSLFDIEKELQCLIIVPQFLSFVVLVVVVMMYKVLVKFNIGNHMNGVGMRTKLELEFYIKLIEFTSNDAYRSSASSSCDTESSI